MRNEKGLSQEKLASILNLSNAFVANIELGRRSISIDTLILLTKFFGCSADYLIGIED